MKKYGAIILIVGIILYMSYMLLAQDNIFSTGQHGSEVGGDDGEDENYLADDQEIFARKLFQKKLAPLSNEEKIVWAFRLSKTTIFL